MLDRTMKPQRPLSRGDSLVDIINDYQCASDLGELLDLGKKNVTAYGFSAMAYHQIPAIGNYSSTGLSRYYSYNLPEDLKRSYDSAYGKKLDPIIQYVMETGTPIWYSEALTLQAFKQGKYVEIINMIITTMGDSLAIPLFGPKLNLGYAFLTLGETHCVATDRRKWIAAATANVFHTRYCTLKNNMAKAISLTAREMEVLELIVMGKTNPDIATILGISKHTVNSYVKNLFMKFSTTDRVSTVVKALTHKVIV